MCSHKSEKGLVVLFLAVEVVLEKKTDTDDLAVEIGSCALVEEGTGGFVELVSKCALV